MSASFDGDGQHLRPLAGVWWAVVGATSGLGVVALLSFGPLLLAVGLVMTVIGARSARRRNRSAFLVLAGAGVAPLLLAWLNREGPGTVCDVAGPVTSCSETYSPLPFLVVAGLLVVTGAVLARPSPAGRQTSRAPRA